MIMHIHNAQLLFSFCFVTMFILTGLSKFNNSNRLFNTKGIFTKNSTLLISLHIAGIFFFGLLPSLFFQQQFTELLSINVKSTISDCCLFIILLLLFASTALHEANKIHSGSLQIYILSNKWLTQYFIARILFLCAYEIFFRGLLLFSCIEWYGAPIAIMISTGLTVIIHVFTNKKEMLGCIPFGLILCSCCISIHAVWPAVLIHTTLSLSHEIPVINYFLTRLKPTR
ncbi:MAG: CPBP family intramembrane glutamic endopeptidase [Ferruginibacter sp.]